MCVCVCVCVQRGGGDPRSGCKQQPCLSLAAASTTAVATTLLELRENETGDGAIYGYLTAGAVMTREEAGQVEGQSLKLWAWFTAITTIQNTIPLQQETWYLSASAFSQP